MTGIFLDLGMQPGPVERFAMIRDHHVVRCRQFQTGATGIAAAILQVPVKGSLPGIDINRPDAQPGVDKRNGDMNRRR